MNCVEEIQCSSGFQQQKNRKEAFFNNKKKVTEK